MEETLGRLRSFLIRNFSGEIFTARQVVDILIPIVVDQAFIVSLGFVNTAMISSSGVNAVSAVNMVDSLNLFLVNVFVAVATGGTVVVAQYKGSGNHAMVSKSAAGTVSSVFLLAAAIGASLILLHSQMLSVLFGSADPQVMALARVYIIGSALSYPGAAIMEAACGALRGVGETKSSLFLSLVNNLSYVLFNFLFINGMHMGVSGMALSLNISRWLAAACSLFYLTRVNVSLGFRLRDAIHFEPAMLKKVFLIGLPFAAEQMFFNGGKILTQTFIVKLGTYALAVNAISSSLIGLYVIPGNAILLGVVTVVGQCIGQGNVPDARKFIRALIAFSTFAVAVCTVLMLPLFNPMLRLFSPPAAIIPEIWKVVLVSGILQAVIWSVSFVLPSALRAGGDAGFTSLVSMLSMWLFRVVLGYILGLHTSLGIFGVWLAMDLEWFVRAVVFYIRYRGDKWYKHHLIG